MVLADGSAGAETVITGPGEQWMSDTPMARYDAIVIGAGFGGLYALHRLRDEMGLSVRAFDGAGGVGGTWWYNRYPGARVDAPSSPFYAYTFSKDLVDEWEWTETQTAGPDVRAYLEHVADRFDLRKDIQFNTRVDRRPVGRGEPSAGRSTPSTARRQRPDS